MDVESPSQGSDKGDADHPKPAANMALKSSFRHHLPQIPVMNMGLKIAQSKASARQDVTRAQTGNKTSETTQLHVEGTGKIVQISGTGRQEEIFTPPETESSSNSSPGDSKPAKNGSSKDRYSDMTGTPIKLRIRRANRDGELDLSSCVDEAPQNTSIDNSFSDSLPLATTPGQLNKSPNTPLSQKQPGKRGRKKRNSSLPPTPLPKPTKSEDGSPRWVVGDMIWSKVSGHPWWPCMVSCDPFDGIHTKLRPGKLSYRLYHVQFFGDEGERGWVSEHSTMPFEGKRQLEEYFKGMQMKVAPKQRAQYKLEVSARRKRAWDVAWQSAEEALPLSHEERKQKYTYSYELAPSPDAGEVNPRSACKKASEEDTGTGRTKTKAKLKKALITARTSRLQGHGPAGSTTPTSEDGVNGESTSKRGRKRKQPHYAESDSEEEDHEASPRRKRKRRDSSSGDVIEGSGKKSQRTGKTDGSFEVFCEKHRESVLSENPDFDDDTLSEYLQQQWDMMDSKQKSRYRSKFVLRPSKSDDEGSPSKDGVVCKRSGRVSKPSAKKMEAEEDKKPTTPKRRLSRISSEEMITPDQVKQEVLDPTPPALEESLLGEATADNISTVEVKSTGESSNVNQETANTTPSTKSEPKRRKSKKGLSAGEKDNSADVTETDSQKTDTPTAQVNKPETVTKRRKSKKLEALADAEHDSDVVSEAPSEIEPLLLLPTDDNYVDLEIAKLSSAGPSKKEAVCQLCENVGELISCEGPCGGTFHADCLDITKAPESGFKCDECSSGVHSCFCCRKSSGDTRRCSAPMCGKFYHEACVKQYTLTKWDTKGFTCPLHSCATCAAENPKSLKPTKGRLFRCVRCPVAYHVGDFCIAAGSIPLAGYNIVCSRHFQPVKTQKHHSHVNVSWCFICNKGGTLLCCESCPAAFHETCLRIQKPEGSWYCRECSLGKRPLYGDVIWIKLGNYRWWPGEICHPKNVPTNIQDKSHQVGEFPVKFLGSNEYFWIHQGRVFLFQEGDKGTKESSTAKGLAKVFARALKQGSKAFRLWKAAKENKAQLEVEKNDKKPAPYKHIKTNIPCGNVVLNKPDLSELPRCECKPTQENPCGPDSECFNRMLMYECHAALCPAGEKCMNQRFQKRQYPESAPFRTSARGWGLKTLVDIKKGEFVNEYVGELVDEEECRRRIKKAHEDNITNFYMLTIDKSRIIDAGPKGNLSRFMNHSCQPNLETQKWTINGEVRVGLFAAVDIPAGSELTFNYNLDCLGNEKTACACGAPICSGFLGVRPKTSAAAANEKRAKEIKKRKKKKPRVDVKKEHEDDCFRCGEGGELVMCDKTACPKAYHLQCLNLAKPPHGKWTCPWHHCDECGKRASQLCSVCPNSFCTDHLEEKVFSAEDGRLICWEHPDLLAKLNVTKVDPASILESTDTNGESGVTDSDSQVSSEDYMEKSGVGDDLAAIQPTDINISRKPSKVQSATKRAKKAEDTDKVTRTGRKVRKRSLDVIDANGIDEKKPKQKTRKPVKKRTLKMSAEESDLSLTSPVRPDGSQAQAEKCESDPPKVQCVNKTPCESAAHIEEVSKDNPRVDAVKDEPMFDDSDEDGFGLVIDIPAV